MGTLYIVATPIGNLEDITLRALRTLKEVDLILCEDTRVTKRLLSRYEITTPTESFHARSERGKTLKVTRLLEEGKNIALVSDAGTPTISDPGEALVREVRRHFGEEVQIVTIPGPSAVAAALSISGVPSSEFLFLGFLPHKKGREKLFAEVAQTKRTVVFYESPHRILATLSSLAKHLGQSRKIAVARELTKIHEEVREGSAEDLFGYFEKNPERVRGEFVVLIEPRH